MTDTHTNLNAFFFILNYKLIQEYTILKVHDIQKTLALIKHRLLISDPGLGVLRSSRRHSDFQSAHNLDFSVFKRKVINYISMSYVAIGTNR